MPMYQDIRLITCFGYCISGRRFFRSRRVSSCYFETYFGELQGGLGEAAAARTTTHQTTLTARC